MAHELQKRMSAFSCRILLMRRRSGRYDTSQVTCYLANSAPGSAWMEQLKLRKVSDLLDLELEAMLFPEPPEIGTPAEEAFLVCTHGRRDPCCAERGRTLLGPLEAAQAPVWESSHQGGHRFAANLACFPHALFYGRVLPGDVSGIVDSYRRGEVVLKNYRGRSAYNPIVQAADHFARTETGESGIEAWKVERVSSREGSASVSFRSAERRHEVVLRLELGEPRRESCNKSKLTTPEVWMLTSFSSTAV